MTEPSRARMVFGGSEERTENMATAKSNGTKHATRTLAEQKAADNEGWEDHSRWDFDGFWKVTEGAILQGTIVEVRAIRDDEGKKKLVYVVQLSAPAQVTRDGEVTTAEAGEVIGCGENFGLRPLRDIFGEKDKPLIRVKAIEQKKLDAKRTLWTFKVQSKGGTPRKRPLEFDAILSDTRYAKGEHETEPAPAADTTDDIPF